MNTSYPNLYDIYFQRFTAELFQDQVALALDESARPGRVQSEPGGSLPGRSHGGDAAYAHTAAEMVNKTGVGVIDAIDGTIMEPHINIFLGIAYDRRCYDIWKAEQGRERIRSAWLL